MSHLRQQYSGIAQPRRAPLEAVVQAARDLVKGPYATRVDQAFLEFPEAMNDRAFGPGTWSRRDDGLPWFRIKLAFVSGVFLWECPWADPGRIVWALEGPDQALVLDGTAQGLRAAHQTFPWNLTKKTAAAYVRFCFATSPEDQGLGFLVDSPDHPIWSRQWAFRKTLPELDGWLYPPQIEEEDEGFSADVSELMDGRYAEMNYHIQADGTMERDEFWGWNDTEKVAGKVLEEANTLRKDHRDAEAAQAFGRAVGILEATEADGALKKSELLARALLGRAQGLPDLHRAVTILISRPQALGREQMLSDAYLLRARALQAAGDVEGALRDLWARSGPESLSPWVWDPFHHELEVLNDRTFGPGTWELVWDRGAVFDSYRAYRIRLGFFPEARLWQVISPLRYSLHKTLWVLEWSGEFLPLGSNQAWERVHQAVEPLLGAETVVAYLRVYGVQKEETPGPFFFVDLDHPLVRHHSPAVREALEGPPKVWEEGPHRWRVSATVFQKNHFYRATFLVTPDGITISQEAL